MNRWMGLIIFPLFVFLCVGCAINPITGEEELMLFSQDEDLQVGLKYAPEINKQLGGEIPDEQLQRYVDSIGQRVASVSHRPDIEYHFRVVQEKSVNAFALPGGYIFVTKGILQHLKTEAQLSGVLAHEVAHVVARDTMAAMSREIGINVLLGAVVASDAPSGAVRMADLTAQILLLKYSRQDEIEADLAGMDYMVKAGYKPTAMVDTMQMLQEQQKVKPIEFFSTHPNPVNRIEYLQERIALRYSQLDTLKVGEDDYRSAVLEKLKDEKSKDKDGRPH
jgi:predicted Zn-dependent protease